MTRFSRLQRISLIEPGMLLFVCTEVNKQEVYLPCEIQKFPNKNLEACLGYSVEIILLSDISRTIICVPYTDLYFKNIS